MPTRLVFGSLLLVLVLAVASPATAASSSSWEVNKQARTRLIASRTAVAPESRSVKIGWEVQLAKGWKTYWRNPGDTGLPPRFDWSGSDNVAGVDVAWPTPERLTAFGYSNAVYKGEVVLPITVRLAKPGVRTRLELKADYMVCNEVCVPHEARYQLTLPAGTAEKTDTAALIARWEAQVPPRQQTLGPAASPGPLHLQAVHLSGKGLELTVRAANGTKGLDAFVDGPEAIAFGRPAIAATSDAHVATLTVPVYGSTHAGLKGRNLVVVLVDGNGDAVQWRGPVAK